MAKVQGIDVSSHQPNIDFDKVIKDNDNIQFVMFRMGFGGDIKSQDDSQFERNVREAERVGLEWGAYLYSYALNLEDAKSEVEHAKRLLKGKNPNLPIGFDMEDADGYKAKHGMPSNEMLVDICELFLSEMEKEGYYVELYASKSWLEEKLKSPKLDRFDKWLAQWNKSDTYDKPHGMWQLSDSGEVDGIKGRVDMDVAYYDFPKIINHGISVSKPEAHVSQPPAHKGKTIDQLANEVIHGQHGYGEDRKRALGDKFDAVQDRVNEILGTPKTHHEKSIEELAKEVLAGKHGTGRDRMRALGNKYAAVQKEVNKLLRK